MAWNERPERGFNVKEILIIEADAKIYLSNDQVLEPLDYSCVVIRALPNDMRITIV